MTLKNFSFQKTNKSGCKINTVHFADVAKGQYRFLVS